MACSVEEVALGAIRIAVLQMANAIKKISVSKGYDVTRQYVLQCFGGAGGQHAGLVAEMLGMTEILIHPCAGVLSAYGMGLAEQTCIKQKTVEESLSNELVERLKPYYVNLIEQARHEMLDVDQCEAHQRIHIKYAGTDLALTLPFGTESEIIQRFEETYLQRFSFLVPEKTLMVESISVEVMVLGERLLEEYDEAIEDLDTLDADHRQEPMVEFFSAGRKVTGKLYFRHQLALGTLIEGPAIIADKLSTTLVEVGWIARVTKEHNLILKRLDPNQRQVTHIDLGKPDPILLEVFNHLFMSIAEQMGLQLQNTAYSVNIKERLDFSCALFDRHGELIANAPHIPVHLGSMSESIKTIIHARLGKMSLGDVFVLNDPYHGGTHLPDVTVITPVWVAPSEAPVFYVASRGHHADIGGITPGSMPAYSTDIAEEGILLNNVLLVDKGKWCEQTLVDLLGQGPYPARNIPQNLADLKAQVAANEKGVQELLRLVKEYGLSAVEKYMQFVQDNAEQAVRQVLKVLKNGQFCLPLDNGAKIQVSLEVDSKNQRARIDFTGTSPQLNNNFNAPKAVSTAAVLYVFRSLVADDIPLNAGCLKPLDIVVPLGCMLNPLPPAGVVAGNVETSTCITNALFGALGVLAGSQPTMNNFTFGNNHFQYYETISGGSGAGGIFDTDGKLVSGFPGTSLVQTHMTNSRLTDPEVLEYRFPVRLLSYAICQHSGGEGRWRGGDGGVRRIMFLQAMKASILSNGRIYPAFGMAGGKAGKVGKNRVIRANGTLEDLGHIAEVTMYPGDIFEISTPGGGGYGEDMAHEDHCLVS
ncbi:MAG: hydantoinase B/oxoprolinase family protein, partial [Gammaproteobacteria bacterium]|nr:hydantoinase B/oxoprolinase family protein [Gammaproteobacteria bacterium]